MASNIAKNIWEVATVSRNRKERLRKTWKIEITDILAKKKLHTQEQKKMQGIDFFCRNKQILGT